MGLRNTTIPANYIFECCLVAPHWETIPRISFSDLKQQNSSHQCPHLLLADKSTIRLKSREIWGAQRMASREGNRKNYVIRSPHLSSNPCPPLTMWSQTLPARQARSEQKNNLRFSWLKNKGHLFLPYNNNVHMDFLGFLFYISVLRPDLNAKSSPHKTHCLFERKETHKTCIDSHSFPWEWYPSLLFMLHWLKWNHVVTPNFKVSEQESILTCPEKKKELQQLWTAQSTMSV